MRMTITNPGKDEVVMPTAVIPVPPGFRFVSTTRPACRRVEGRERRVRGPGLLQEARRRASRSSITYELEAEATCEVTQRGIEAYAYYSPEIRGNSAPLRLTVR